MSRLASRRSFSVPGLRPGLASLLLLGSLTIASRPVAQPSATGNWSTPFSPRFVTILPGSFLMGSPPGEPSSKLDEVQHRVTITRPFALAVTEVTQGLWLAVTGENPSYFAPCDSCPVDRVSWLDAVRFCNAYSKREGLDPAYLINEDDVRWIRESDGLRLPTEAEWEYACRAGSITAFSAGPCLSTDQGNYNGYYPLGHCPSGMNRGEPIETGRLSPNGWGLQDMHGNVAEWCWDVYGDYPDGPVSDPSGPPELGLSEPRILRGGCFINFAPKCRSADREGLEPLKRVDILGLRLARSKGKG